MDNADDVEVTGLETRGELLCDTNAFPGVAMAKRKATAEVQRETILFEVP